MKNSHCIFVLAWVAAGLILIAGTVQPSRAQNERSEGTGQKGQPQQAPEQEQSPGLVASPSGVATVAGAKKYVPPPPHDMSGVWQYQGSGGSDSVAPEKDMPPMTPWAQKLFDAEKPGYGSRATPRGNDPILDCSPTGFPRVMFVPTPFEFVVTPERTFQFFEREHEYRTIWTDGRPLPTDADSTWYGYAIGRWEGDYTFVVESSGFNDKTWLGATGYPHSDAMLVTEKYQRVSYDTIRYDITVYDPVAYTKPIVGPTRTMKLKPDAEIQELPCVWTEEHSFAERIRNPASK